MKSILFVCMANICRSPALEAVLKYLAESRGVADRFYVDSCGIGWFHLGSPPDTRVFEAARARGILIDHRAQQFQESFFDVFDLILTVDPVVSEQIKLRAKNLEQIQKIRLATDFSRAFKGQSIPDPYYLSPNGFEEIMDMSIDCCEGILQQFCP